MLVTGKMVCVMAKEHSIIRMAVSMKVTGAKTLRRDMVFSHSKMVQSMKVLS